MLAFGQRAARAVVRWRSRRDSSSRASPRSRISSSSSCRVVPRSAAASLNAPRWRETRARMRSRSRWPNSRSNPAARNRASSAAGESGRAGVPSLAASAARRGPTSRRTARNSSPCAAEGSSAVRSFFSGRAGSRFGAATAFATSSGFARTPAALDRLRPGMRFDAGGSFSLRLCSSCAAIAASARSASLRAAVSSFSFADRRSTGTLAEDLRDVATGISVSSPRNSFPVLRRNCSLSTSAVNSSSDQPSALATSAVSRW